MDKRAILLSIAFGHRVAEDETEVGSGRHGCRSGKVKVLPPSVASIDG